MRPLKATASEVISFLYIGTALRGIISAGEQLPNALMLNINYCKSILNTQDFNLTDEQVTELREYLYFLAGLQIEDEMAKEGLAR